ncbi:MAG TPA: pilus assembly protein TadG-related protein [Mycobacteriales bacterium]|nr:pilus assembly protein TadG-related protein [Mycobacteriales bacterium]
MTSRLRRRLSTDDTDRGSISLYFAITALAALVMAGFVVDGGAALATRERAADLATQAARAGATALTPTSLRGTPTDLQADPTAATQAAQAILNDAGATGQVTVSGDTVTVTAHLPRHTVILSAVGLTNISQTATASATAVIGTATGPEGG